MGVAISPLSMRTVRYEQVDGEHDQDENEKGSAIAHPD